MIGQDRALKEDTESYHDELAELERIDGERRARLEREFYDDLRKYGAEQIVGYLYDAEKELARLLDMIDAVNSIEVIKNERRLIIERAKERAVI